MTEAEIISQLNEVFRNVFKKPDLEVFRAMTAADVKGWDSLSHVEMIAQVEKAFQVKFKMKDVMKWKNVGDLIDTLLRYKNPN